MSNENAIFRSIEIIESRISEKLSVQDIASSIYFSKYHYQRLFREIVGDSVMDYVVKRKLTLAGSELIFTDKSVLDIALDFGYTSHESFTRSFKSYMGISPTACRKYSLAAISQNNISHKCIKERFIMIYSQNTNEIIRELNEFIVKAKETAESARKCTDEAYVPFWRVIADYTDAFADKLKNGLDRITALSENPDAITNRFAIIKFIEDVAFQTNLLAFNVRLMVARGSPQHVEIQEPLCEMYKELATVSAIKTSKVVTLFNEFSALIFDDMRKTAMAKIQSLINQGQKAAKGIQGYSYIKDEILNIVNELSNMPCEEISAENVEDYSFRISIISFAADMDIFRNPKDKDIFDELKKLKNDFAEAVDFLSDLVITETNPALTRTINKHFEDIAYQGNILLFYTRGEISQEKAGHFLNAEQKVAFEDICAKINDFILYTLKAADDTAYQSIADMLHSINIDMNIQADILAQKGGTVRFLASEFNSLADSVDKHVRQQQ